MLPKEVPRGAPPPDKKLLEHHFVFACVWAFGGCLLVDKVVDYRLQFSRWWQSEHKAVVFPTEVGMQAAEVVGMVCLGYEEAVGWQRRGRGG